MRKKWVKTDLSLWVASILRFPTQSEYLRVLGCRKTTDMYLLHKILGNLRTSCPGTPRKQIELFLNLTQQKTCIRVFTLPGSYYNFSSTFFSTHTHTHTHTPSHHYSNSYLIVMIYDIWQMSLTIFSFWFSCLLKNMLFLI